MGEACDGAWRSLQPLQLAIMEKGFSPDVERDTKLYLPLSGSLQVENWNADADLEGQQTSAMESEKANIL